MGETFPTIVYVLCFLTSAACALLLGRSYRRTGVRLLFWSGVCFALLAVNNLALVVDLVLWPDGDLRLSRVILSLIAVVSLLWGFIWDSQETER
jgi:hypothetical protein